MRASGTRESVCASRKGGSSKQANPELVARTVKGRGGGGGRFKQKKRVHPRPESVTQKSGIAVNSDFRSHTLVPGWRLRACIFEAPWKVSMCSYLGT